MCIGCTIQFLRENSKECPVCQTQCHYRVEISAKPVNYPNYTVGRMFGRYESFRVNCYQKVLHCNFNSNRMFRLPVTVFIGLVNENERHCENQISSFVEKREQFSLFYYNCKIKGDLLTFYKHSIDDWTVSIEESEKWLQTVRCQHFKQMVTKLQILEKVNIFPDK